MGARGRLGFYSKVDCEGKLRRLSVRKSELGIDYLHRRHYFSARTINIPPSEYPEFDPDHEQALHDFGSKLEGLRRRIKKLHATSREHFARRKEMETNRFDKDYGSINTILRDLGTELENIVPLFGVSWMRAVVPVADIELAKKDYGTLLGLSSPIPLPSEKTFLDSARHVAYAQVGAVVLLRQPKSSGESVAAHSGALESSHSSEIHIHVRNVFDVYNRVKLKLCAIGVRIERAAGPVSEHWSTFVVRDRDNNLICFTSRKIPPQRI